MVEHCPDHSKLMQDVGVICGQVKTLVEGQAKMFDKLDGLSITTAVEKTKSKPIYWALAIIAAIVLSSATATALSHIWTIPQQQTKTVGK